MTSPKAQSNKSSKRSKNTPPTPAPQPSASEPIPFRPTEPTPTAAAPIDRYQHINAAAGWIDDATIALTRIVSYIDHPAHVDDEAAREALAVAFDALECARIELAIEGEPTAVEVQS